MLTIWNFSCQPSTCRAAGALAFALAMAGTLLISAGPSPAGKASTHFFEIETCPLSAGGYVLRAGSSPCPSDTSSSRGAEDKLLVPLFAGELDPERMYHLVLLLPSGSHARLSIAATDARHRYVHRIRACLTHASPVSWVRPCRSMSMFTPPPRTFAYLTRAAL